MSVFQKKVNPYYFGSNKVDR
eukprot:COSAG06_NODE_38516_length_422_cov_2.588235_1_plen_20_part_10